MGNTAGNWSSPDGGTNQALLVKILIGVSAAVVVALVAVVALIATGANGSSEDPDAATTTTVVVPSSSQSPPASKPVTDQEPTGEAAAPDAVPPVAGAYPGGGGPRPATAEPLPTYVGRYTKIVSAHLLTPSGNIGCDFNAPNDSGGQGLCGIVSFNSPSSPLGTKKSVGNRKGKWIFPFAANRIGEPTIGSGTTGWMNQPASDGYQVPVAEYGKQYYFKDWVCASEEPGLTCWNTGTGSGVFLSREKAERFDGPATPDPADSSRGQDADDVVFGSMASNGKGLGQSRPGIIYFGSDPTGRVMDVTWSFWGGDKAEATGLGNWREDGVGTHEAPATVVAFDVGTCNGKRAYRKADIFFPERGETFDPASGVNICFTDR